MNKDKHRQKAALKEFKKPVTAFEQIDLTQATYVPDGMTRAYRNTRYTVMVYDDSPTSHGPAIRVMVQKHDNTSILKHWSEMQQIKNEIFGGEVTAVEYYPAVSQLIDRFNIYWFWIFPEGVLPIPILSI
ncbi:hypothetical protein EXU85_20505 [Spirosoma sp. KCTC 42546]|uniref:DUF7694 domain-containing protein n=1 Tax=Spirosoma sp. KCTC 42546 TaxID=2520506 RepID=UPI00115BD719|nr:hypothetical protein [Spirosoma sp. KCTC 42546]QDK80862.1 hypothetical protein EXU85_20505 [Spirosoma sp. KCTC 42546]